jgi:hypothetical protein
MPVESRPLGFCCQNICVCGSAGRWTAYIGNGGSSGMRYATLTVFRSLALSELRCVVIRVWNWARHSDHIRELSHCSTGSESEEPRTRPAHHQESVRVPAARKCYRKTITA